MNNSISTICHWITIEYLYIYSVLYIQYRIGLKPKLILVALLLYIKSDFS